MKAMSALATAVIVFTGAIAMSSTAANACPNGYHQVNWQHSGHWICVVNTGGNNALRANTGPQSGRNATLNRGTPRIVRRR